MPIMRRALISMVVFLLLACSGASSPDRDAAPHVDGRPTEGIESRPLDTPTPAADAAIPAPNEPIPGSPDRLADALATTTFALREAIDGWAEGVGISAPPPRDVRLLAFHQQRLYWSLTEDPQLARLTIPRLPAGLAG